MELNRKNIVLLAVLTISQMFGLSLWFSTNAIVDQLKSAWNLSVSDIGLLSISVTIGFILGALGFSILSLPDLLKAKNLYFIASILGALTNFLLVFSPDFIVVLLLRIITGISLAGIYPVGMKMTASYFKYHRGLAIGVLLGATTAGSGLPYLFNLIGVPEWQILLTFSSLLALLGGILIFLLVSEGPYSGNSKFSLANIKKIIKKNVILSNFGYFGHMFELYAFWVWIPVFLAYSYTSAFPSEEPLLFFSLGTFMIFLTGALANGIGGHIADRIGKAKFNIIMLFFSGFSSLIIGFFVSSPYLALLIAIFWGITIIPDSPQYSSLIASLTDQDLVGTSLTIQTSVGFAITVISINLIPILVKYVGWNFAFAFLVIGPVTGIISMLLLSKDPEYILKRKTNAV